MTRLLLRGRVVTPDAVLDRGLVAVDGTRIARVEDCATLGRADLGPGWPDPQDHPGYLLPGLVDTHCHGGGGFGFAESDAEGALAAARHHAAHGTTTLLAGLVTAPPEQLIRQVDVLAGLCRAGELAGIHLEGPFLAPAHCGAQSPAHMLTGAHRHVLDDLLTRAAGAVRAVTVAPEVPGGPDLVRAVAAAGAVVAIGHTGASAAQTRAAVASARATGGREVAATHLFNGMAPIHHRSPGPALTLLALAARGDVVVELVADGVHLAPATVAAVFDLLGPDRIALVTDAMAAAGMPDGPYRLGPRHVDVRDGVARLSGDGPDTGALAGGTSRLIDVVRSCVVNGIALVDAVRSAATTPARLHGLAGEAGGLVQGARADVLVTDEALQAVDVLVGGRWRTGS